MGRQMRAEVSQSPRSASPLLPALEVARLLGVSVATVKRLTAAGELPHIMVSRRRRRYRVEDVDRFVDARRIDGAQRAAQDADASAGTEAPSTTHAGAGGEGATPE
jgi:excisionase family DNA binding protein